MDSRIYILTHKQLTGQLSIAEHDEFRKLSLDPKLKSLSDEIAYLWNVSNNYFPTKDWKKDDAKEAFYEKIRQPVTSKTQKSNTTGSFAPTYNLNWVRVIGFAALALLIGWVAISLLTKKEKIEAVKSIEFAEIFDNTRIWLDQGASLTILKESDNENKVALVGEAFFDVYHDPSRLFVIDLGNEVFAEVLGTSFKARSTHGGNNGKISVREGSVRLYSTANADYDITLQAGEEGELNPAKRLEQKSNTTSIGALLPQVGQLSFDDTPLDEVLDKLGLHFGVQFKYDREVISKCRFSAGVPSDASIDQTLLSILGVHEGLKVTPQDRSTYMVSGSCHK